MKRAWRTSAVPLVGAILAVGTIACGGGDDAPAETPASAPRPATENQIKPLPRDQVQDGGRLVWPINAMPVTYNYNHLDGPDGDAIHVMFSLVPRFYTFDASSTPIWNPDYLASEPTLVTEPKQVVTFNINPKAAWYDGTPITWEDFYWQWQATNGTNPAYQIASSNGYREIEDVARGRDDREVVVTFKNRYADWQPIFYGVYPASTNKSPEIFNEGWKSRPLTTAGPFKIDSIDPTAQTVTLVRNEKWWGDPAKLDTIIFRAIDADAQIDALANGEVDLMEIGPEVNKYMRAQSIAGTEIRVAGGPNFRHITLNGSGPILQDVRVRRALAMAIDRAAITRAMLGPLGMEAEPLGNHLFMRNQAGYQDNSGEVGRYDPDRAAQLLDEAGWRLEGGVRRKDSRVLEVTTVIPTAVAVSRQESELVQNMLGQIGIRLQINTVPSPDFFEEYVRPGQFDLTHFSWMGTPFPISSSQSIYANPTKGPDGQLIVQQNYARVGSPEIDALYAQANSELDRQTAIAIANKIDALIWQEVHSLTLYQRPDMWAVKSNLANVGAFGFADLSYENIGWAKQ